MKMNPTVSKFLASKTTLNVVFVIALINVIGYLMIGDIHAIVYFVLVALLTSYFSKNMIIVLGVPIILINLFAMQQNSGVEGFESKDKKKDDKKKADDKKTTSDTATDEKPESFEVGRGKNRGSQIDYASTVEDAYDNLNNILKGDGMKRLTGDTQRLMEQQLQLTEAMKGMGPMLEGMAPMIDKLQGMMGQINGVDKLNLGGISKMAKQFQNNRAPM
jgi:hypothetical protein